LRNGVTTGNANRARKDEHAMIQGWRFLILMAACWATLAQDAPVGNRTATDNDRAISVDGRDRRVRPGPRDTAKKPRLRTTVSGGGGAPAIAFLGSALTPSPAESFALNGNIAYVCDDNEVSIVDVTNSLNPHRVGTAVSTIINNSADIHCSIQGGSLLIFADQSSSTIGNTPAFIAFSLANPLQPQLIAATPLSKRFFQDPVYLGPLAFVPTAATDYDAHSGSWNNQFGDLLAVDVSSLSNPRLLGTLEQPQIDTALGGPTSVFGATSAATSLVYLGGSTSTSNQNNGIGRLLVVDVGNPLAMKVVGQIAIPGTIHFFAPLIQATVAVGIGNTGGYVGALNANPSDKGNIVVATFDVTDRRLPALLYSTVTSYSVGQGGGATRIGNNLFAFAGVVDARNNPVLLVVDITNPQSPAIQSFPIPQPFTSMQAAGSTLYATLGSGGFATYSIPGGTLPVLSCPTSLDAIIVFDRGASVSAQAFSNAKTSVKSLIDSLHLSPDQVGVASFTSTANLVQTLTTNGPQAKSAIDAILGGGASYIGSGIVAAQTELTSQRHNPSATPLMIVVSDGGDRGAANGSATLSAANAAKTAGMRIISLQYGSATGTLMQSIASSSTDYYVVPTP
jgi:hypothetical protein